MRRQITFIVLVWTSSLATAHHSRSAFDLAGRRCCFQDFTDALDEYMRLAAELFREEQGGLYNGPLVALVVDQPGAPRARLARPHVDHPLRPGLAAAASTQHGGRCQRVRREVERVERHRRDEARIGLSRRATRPA